MVHYIEKIRTTGPSVWPEAAPGTGVVRRAKLIVECNLGVLAILWHFGPFVQARFVGILGNLIQCRPASTITALAIRNYFAQMESLPGLGVSPEQST